MYYKAWPGFCRRYQGSVSELSVQVSLQVLSSLKGRLFFFFFFGGEDSKQKISSMLPVCLYFYCQILGKLSEHFSSFVWDHGSQPFTNAVLSLSGHNCL